jgi:hypothetical protein
VFTHANSIAFSGSAEKIDPAAAVEADLLGGCSDPDGRTLILFGPSRSEEGRCRCAVSSGATEREENRPTARETLDLDCRLAGCPALLSSCTDNCVRPSVLCADATAVSISETPRTDTHTVDHAPPNVDNQPPRQKKSVRWLDQLLGTPQHTQERSAVQCVSGIDRDGTTHGLETAAPLPTAVGLGVRQGSRRGGGGLDWVVVFSVTEIRWGCSRVPLATGSTPTLRGKIDQAWRRTVWST